MKYAYQVIRISTGGNCGDHKTLTAAEKRIGRLVAMSNGKLTRADFRVDAIC